MALQFETTSVHVSPAIGEVSIRRHPDLPNARPASRSTTTQSAEGTQQIERLQALTSSEAEHDQEKRSSAVLLRISQMTASLISNVIALPSLRQPAEATRSLSPWMRKSISCAGMTCQVLLLNQSHRHREMIRIEPTLIASPATVPSDGDGFKLQMIKAFDDRV